MKDISSFPLKERKKARMRLALANALISRTDQYSFDKISVENLCQDAEISRATFFRLFPHKTDLIFFAINLWIIELGITLDRMDTIRSGYRKIETFFHLSADSFEKHQNFLIAAIAERSLDPVLYNRQDNDYTRVSALERLIRFPDSNDIENIIQGGFTYLLRDYVNLSIRLNELPQNTDPETTVLSLACLFYGIPIMLSDRSASHLSKAYSQQLKVIWKGLGGTITPGEIGY